MDKFDIIKSYLLDEGFAETEEAAIGMMVSMSESWKEEILDENRRAARSAGGYKDDSKKQTDPSKDGFTGISGSIADIMRQNKEIEAKNKKMKKEEVEVEEGYKEIDQAKKNRMFRRAGNLSRDAISTPIPPEKRQDAHKKSGKIIKQLNKLNQEEVVLEKKKDDTYLETDMKKRQENNEKARKDMEKMGTKMKNPHFEEVQQVDEALPLLAAVPAMLGKAAVVAGKGAAMGMKGKLKLKMKDMAKDAVKQKAQDMASNAKDSASSAVTDNNPLDSLKNSHEPQGEQIHEISAETALAASKGRDKQAMMLKGPEHTEKRAELRAKASQNYDRAVKKRKAGYVKNTASPQGPARKMTAESISDIVALRAEMLNEEKE